MYPGAARAGTWIHALLGIFDLPIRLRGTAFSGITFSRSVDTTYVKQTLVTQQYSYTSAEYIFICSNYTGAPINYNSTVAAILASDIHSERSTEFHETGIAL